MCKTLFCHLVLKSIYKEEKKKKGCDKMKEYCNNYQVGKILTINPELVCGLRQYI